jgi:hypothetical protein
VITDLDGQGNCMQCHQGRDVHRPGRTEATAGIEPDDVVSEELEFRSACTTARRRRPRWGSEVRGGYEYPDREYVGYFEHTSAYQECTQCHDPHSLRSQPAAVQPVPFAGGRIRRPARHPREGTEDWDGDGDTQPRGSLSR